MNKISTIKDAAENARTGLRLRGLRKKKGISMRWVAGTIKVSEALLSYLEVGKRNWTPELEQAYLKAIGEI